MGPAPPPPGHELPDLVVADVGAKGLVARDDLLADLLHLVGREARVDPHVAERPVEPVNVLPHAEALAVERARHVEHAVADEKAAIQGIDSDLVEGHPLSAEVRGVVGHETPPAAYRCRSAGEARPSPLPAPPGGEGASIAQGGGGIPPCRRAHVPTILACGRAAERVRARACGKNPRGRSSMATHIFAGAAHWTAEAPDEATGGLYRRAVGGDRWECLGGLPPGAGVRAIAVHPRDARVVYAGTSLGPYRSARRRRYLAPPGATGPGARGLVLPLRPALARRDVHGHVADRRLSQPGRRRYLDAARRAQAARPGRHELPRPRHAARRRPERAPGALRRARGGRGDAQPGRGRELGRREPRPGQARRAPASQEPHRERHRDRGHDGHARPLRIGRPARHGLPRPAHGALQEWRPRIDLGGHGSRPVLPVDLRARRPGVTPRPAHALHVPEPGRPQRGRLALPE